MKNNYVQQDSFQIQQDFLSNPLMATIKLARYKFPAKMLSSFDNVLDLGCGSGAGSYYYAHHTAGEVTGLDASENLEAHSSHYKKENLKFIQADITNPPEEVLKSKYDVIISVDVIEHFEKEDGIQLLQNYAKLLNKGGLMITGTPNVYSAPYRSAQSKQIHIHEYAPEELREIKEEIFDRVLYFSMNDEVIHTGFDKMSWFFYLLAFKA